MIVADTNLVVSLIVPESRTQAARTVRARDGDWVAPPLWASEFQNVLATVVRTGHLTREGAMEVWDAGRSLVRDVEVDPVSALDAAFARGLSGYDAEFVALAEALGAPLVTEDRRVLAACPGLAVSLDAFGKDAADAPGR